MTNPATPATPRCPCDEGVLHHADRDEGVLHHAAAAILVSRNRPAMVIPISVASGI